MLKVNFILIISLCLLIGLNEVVNAQMTVTYRAPESASDERYLYEYELLQLVLERTKNSHGDYVLEASAPMNFNRAYQELRAGNIENFIIKDSARDSYMEEFEYLPIPVARGIFGYRIFFTNPQVADQLKGVQTLEDLQQFSIGQGSGWVDVDILRSNGFQVDEVGNFDSLFRMVGANRFNLFSRGTNEILSEYNSYSSQVQNLVLDESVVLYYPVPRFLFTSPGNTEVLERIEAGLEIIFNDGSFIELWESHFQESLDFVNLQDRIIFSVDNPTIQTLDMSELEQYIFNPLED